jgi:hypothetical protein
MDLIGHAMDLASSGSRVSATVSTAISASIAVRSAIGATVAGATITGATVGTTICATITGTTVCATITGTAVGAAILHSSHAIGAGVRRALCVSGAGRGVTIVVHAHPNLQV